MHKPANLGTAFKAVALASAFTLALGALPASAQSSRETNNRIEQLERQLQRMQGQMPAGGGAAGMSPDAAGDIQVRLLRIEQMIEQLTGQVEELRFQSRQTATQLQQLSDDLNYRVAVLEQGGAAAAGTPGAARPAQATPPMQQRPTTMPGQTGAPRAGQTSAPPRSPSLPPQYGGVVDPDAPLSQPVSAQPQASPRPTANANTGVAQTNVAPQPGSQPAMTDNGFVIRTDASGAALPPDPNQPQTPPPVIEDNAMPQMIPQTAPAVGAVSAGQLAVAPMAGDVALPNAAPKEQYEYAFDLLKRQDFARAEVALREFLKQHPKDPLAGNAQYWLGETYYVRGDFQQAAVEFMSGYQNYPKSSKGPDNLLKLGMSMASLGQGQGACTAFDRIAKEYPESTDQIRRSAQAERGRLKCK